MERGTTSARVDEDDLALIDAVHVSPRASFEQLGAALGVSAETAGRRWRRLSSAGYAWVSSAPGPAMAMAGAVVDVDCRPRDVRVVAEHLANTPQVASVHLVSGEYAIHALVFAADSAGLHRLLVEIPAESAAIRRTNVHVASHLFSGQHWRLGAISAQAAEGLAPLAPAGARPTPALYSESSDRKLFLALQDDGRATLRDLARRVGRSEQSVRRRLDALTRSGALTMRTDFVRPGGGWPIHVVLTLRVADEELDDVGRGLGSWTEVRVCLGVVGSDNLLVTAQLHDLGSLDPLLVRIRTTWPHVSVGARRVVLRSVKSWGRKLDDAGRAVEVVPVDPWA